MTSKKKTYNDEIDLIKAISLIIESKFKISIIITLCIIVFFFNEIYKKDQSKNSLMLEAETTIKPISTFEEIKYQNFNDYIKFKKGKNRFFLNSSNNLDNELNVTNLLDDYYFLQNNLHDFFKEIDKKYLINLFADKINENILLIDAIKKFKLINKKDFTNSQEYEIAVLRLASSVETKYTKSQNNEMAVLSIVFKTEVENKDLWLKILSHIEQNANLEIRNYLIESFDRLIYSNSTFLKYKIEDIASIKKGISEKDNNYEKLENYNKFILDAINKDTDRLNTVFNSTPIPNLNEFYAAKINIQTTKFRKIKNKESLDTVTKLVLYITIGLLLSMIYVFIENSLIRRK